MAMPTLAYMGEAPKDRDGRRTFEAKPKPTVLGNLFFWMVVTVLLFISFMLFDLYFHRKVAPVALPAAEVDQILSVPETASINARLEANFNKVYHIRPPIVANPPSSDKGDMRMQDLYQIVSNWNPDLPDEPDDFMETLQHFNFGDEYERAIALRYREAEVPFKLYNVSDFNRVANLWSDDYLLHVVPSNKERMHIERSPSNHFMFWTRKGQRRHTQFKEPTEIVAGMSFRDWLALAKKADTEKLGHNSSHLYFMTSADAHEHGRTFISRDLPLFSTKKDNFFISNVRANKGIQCRFGMRGIIAEAHYDSGRNMVAMLKGAKRYILAPPWSCEKLGIIADQKHPSFRHSVIDWSDPEQARSRGFAGVDAIDTVVRMGEVLYIPSFWFHYIISLNYSIQCNSRSGFPPHRKGVEHINKCFKYTLK